MEAALEANDWKGALVHLERMSGSSSTEDLNRCKLLPTYLVDNELPILHHLVYLTFQEEDTPRLEKFIKILTDFGCDINKQVPEMADFTAVMASIQEGNLIFLRCLLRHGARVDIRDEDGLTPCHLAILFKNPDCFKALVEFGGRAALETARMETSGEKDIHPILHTAVDSDSREIVSFLMTLKEEEFGVNLNEKAVYKNVHGEYLEFTPLQRAFYWGRIFMMKLLLEKDPSKVPGFTELHECLQSGFMEMASLILEHFSNEELAQDRIGDKWALHCVNGRAFTEESVVPFTKKVILEYVRRGGWDVNSPCVSQTHWEIPLDEETKNLTLSKYNLLHIACLHQAHLEIIKLLVEETGMDVNCKMEGEVDYTPLLVSSYNRNWDVAGYFIEKGADLNQTGIMKDLVLTPVMRKNLVTGEMEQIIRMNAVDHLLMFGNPDGFPILDQVMSPSSQYVWQGANELHISLRGGNPLYILKVLEHSAKNISKQDLNWVTLHQESGPYQVPSLMLLMNYMKHTFEHPGLTEEDTQALADIIQRSVKLGYNINLNTDEHSVFSVLSLNLPQDSPKNLDLVRTILQVDMLEFYPREGYRVNPVDLLKVILLNGCRDSTTGCKNHEKSWPVEALKLFVVSGIDLSGVVIDPDFTFHLGCSKIFKMLFCAGAHISDNFFTDDSLCAYSRNDYKLVEEFKGLKEWKQGFDKEESFSLKHLSRVAVRKVMKRVVDVKMLDGVHKELKKYVLCQK